MGRFAPSHFTGKFNTVGGAPPRSANAAGQDRLALKFPRPTDAMATPYFQARDTAVLGTLFASTTESV